jgi:AraC-like DNA-binding protein
MVGFHSVSSFNRYFAKLMQMSPREYRKQMQQSEKKAENQSILEFAGWMRPE